MVGGRHGASDLNVVNYSERESLRSEGTNAVAERRTHKRTNQNVVGILLCQQALLGRNVGEAKGLADELLPLPARVATGGRCQGARGTARGTRARVRGRESE